jgi:uncharacterized membrane-anchored protein
MGTAYFSQGDYKVFWEALLNTYDLLAKFVLLFIIILLLFIDRKRFFVDNTTFYMLIFIVLINVPVGLSLMLLANFIFQAGNRN